MSVAKAFSLRIIGWNHLKTSCEKHRLDLEIASCTRHCLKTLVAGVPPHRLQDRIGCSALIGCIPFTIEYQRR
jgi:hypothetical protein